MENDETSLYSVEKFTSSLVKETLDEVYTSLEKRGYNPVNQLVGYLTSGDLGYISSYENARNKLSKLERSQIIEVILKEYLSKWDT